MGRVDALLRPLAVPSGRRCAEGPNSSTSTPTGDRDPDSSMGSGANRSAVSCGWMTPTPPLSRAATRAASFESATPTHAGRPCCSARAPTMLASSPSDAQSMALPAQSKNTTQSPATSATSTRALTVWATSASAATATCMVSSSRARTSNSSHTARACATVICRRTPASSASTEIARTTRRPCQSAPPRPAPRQRPLRTPDDRNRAPLNRGIDTVQCRQRQLRNPETSDARRASHLTLGSRNRRYDQACARFAERRLLALAQTHPAIEAVEQRTRTILMREGDALT